MSTRRAYFSSGEIIEQTGGKAAFRRNVQITQKYADAPLKVWFRDCAAWREAYEKSNEKWAHEHGFASYAEFQSRVKVTNNADGSVSISMPPCGLYGR